MTVKIHLIMSVSIRVLSIHCYKRICQSSQGSVYMVENENFTFRNVFKRIPVDLEGHMIGFRYPAYVDKGVYIDLSDYKTWPEVAPLAMC